MKLLKILPAMLAVFLFCGCGADASAPPDYGPSESSRLTIYTSHKEEVYMPIIREFEERTGIWVDIVTGGSTELLERIEAEMDAPVADVMFGGGVESLESYKHCFCPYVCAGSGSIREQFRAEGAYWTPFSALPVVLIYNTKLVSPEQLTGWSSLEDPAFAGRIAFADPTVSGSSFTALVTRMYAAGGDSEAALRRLADRLQGNQLDSSGAVLTAVADGSYLVGITLEETALKRIASGADIALVYPADGTSCVPDASALVKNAPHSDNAKKFLDFTVSYDVQKLLSENLFRRTVLSDIAADDSLPPLSGLRLVDYDVEWVSKHRDQILSNWAFFLKEAQP